MEIAAVSRGAPPRVIVTGDGAASISNTTGSEKLAKIRGEAVKGQGEAVKSQRKSEERQ